MILHVTDFHCAECWYEWLVKVSDRYSLVCITGDLLDLTPNIKRSDQSDMVLGFLREIKAPMAIVSGNHDSASGDFPRFQRAGWMHELGRDHAFVDGESFEHSGFLFRCLGWHERLPIAGPKEVWLHHAPPNLARTAFSRGGCDFGDFDLGEHVRAGLGPRLVLSGHVHDPVLNADRVGDCWLLNPGFADSSTVPNYFEIDLERAVAMHREASGGAKTEKHLRSLTTAIHGSK